jgi:Mg-chelatase subunit ChlD
VNSSRRLFAALSSLVAVAGIAGPCAAQGPFRRPPAAAEPPPAPRAPLSQSETQNLVKAYAAAENWTMRAIVLLSLGSSFHPAGAEIVAAAIDDKDARLHAFAIELLRGMNADAAPAVATAPLLKALIARSDCKNAFVRARLLEALARLVPDAGCSDAAGWTRWWNDHGAGWAPPPWQAPAPVPKKPGGTVARSVVERAFYLRDAGLEVMFVLDTTGSMQIAIDAARDAIDEVSLLLAGVSPKLRLGLVQYKDFGDLTDGAQLLVPLTRDHQQVREKLSHIVAGGGGDPPERVEKGVEFALGKETGWTRTANHMLLIVGDAPPHDQDVAGLLEMVQRAHDAPFAPPPKKAAVTGAAQEKKDDARPFVTSAIATSNAAKPAFDAIAKAGGGASVLLELQAGKPGARPLFGDGGGKRGGKEGGKDGKPEAAGARQEQRSSGRRTAAERIAEHVLLLSFGQGYAAELRVFVDTFFDYHGAGAF